ncbi:helix-turn-helix domain-containing protein [Leifsonella bigeumensis]|uniref:helix-turn-helix domain-containing protein n=1 Tax=Leifsonella bigeumensis TaxID=433643 RepID=UPI0031E49221
MDIVVGVVGPHDLVADVATICEQQPSVRVERFAYAHESEAPAIVEANTRLVDAWLFTGVIPYTLAAEQLQRPAGYVDYTGATLLNALVRLLREGHDITRLSIDTLAAAEVNAVFTEADIPTDNLSALAFRPGVTSEKLVRFHRKNAAAGSVAITCVSSVYSELREDITILRLVPSWHSIQTSIRQLLLVTTNQVQEESQVVLGIVEAAPGSPELDGDVAAEAAALAGTAARYGDAQRLIVTTRGQLSAATDQLTSAPLLRRLAAGRSEARIGFGLGRTVAESEVLARRAIARARTHGPVSAVASFRHDIDILLEAGPEPTSVQSARQQPSIGVIAARVGLSVQTVQRLRDFVASADEQGLTTRDIAAELGVQQRTARRILQRLELAGFAERTGHLSLVSAGRPLTLYRLRV